jgi:peptidyl-prolyl cis-trans isomerase SurA
MNLISVLSVRPFRALAPAFLICSLAAGCGGGVPPAPSPDVWAVVDGREIRKEDVERAYRRIAPAEAAPSEDEAVSAKLRIVAELIDQQVLLGRAEALKIAVPDADIDKAFAERKSNMSDDVFQKELTQRALTPDDMKRDLRREMTVQKLLEQEVGSKITITDEAIRDFFDQNREQFNIPETRHRVAQIVVTPARDPQLRNRANDDAATPAEADRKLQMLVERLKSGADFATLAMDYSEDPQSGPQGGDMGFIPASALNQVAPQLRDAVLKTIPGGVSTVSIGGAHTIVLVVGREEAGQRSLSSPGVREGITELLRGRKEQLLGAAYLAAARNEAKVVNYLAKQIVEAQGVRPGIAPAAPGGD